MSALLSSHLEQIATCAQSIAELPFPGPKSFTNAILSTGDITRLIRDTEPHERALYQLAPPISQQTAYPAAHSSIGSAAAKARRATVHAARQSRNRAVATVLGGDLYDQIRQQSKGEVDVGLLLHGAKKLANVYPVPGASERIMELQRRFEQLERNIAHYEARVAEQRQVLEQMNIPAAPADLGETDTTVDTTRADGSATLRVQSQATSLEDPTVVSSEIEQLEQRRKALEARVSGMDRDLNELTR